MGYLDGFGVILKKFAGVHSDSGRRVTAEYPEQVRPKSERYHGRHVLNRYEDGMEKCIGCELCAGVCPARCIYVRGRDNDPDDPTSPGERYGYVYEINYLRCIHCDLCVEACPTEAITETKMFEFAFTIPTRHLIRNGMAKSVLRDAMRGIVPVRVLDNPRKVGFNAPIFSFLDVADPDVCAAILAPSPIFEHIRRSEIEALVSKPDLPNSESKFLFYFVNAKLFLEEFV